MKKLRERLSNKKGFTLVELIVVIVIILILAAVLIPNVMRYISSARESAFQSEASGYMTEITGYGAEHYAKYGKDLPDGTGSFGAKDDAADPDEHGNGAKYALTAYDTKVNSVTVKNSDVSALSGTEAAGTIVVTIEKGAVTSFGYTDGTYYVNWTQDTGWGKVSKATPSA